MGGWPKDTRCFCRVFHSQVAPRLVEAINKVCKKFNDAKLFDMGLQCRAITHIKKEVGQDPIARLLVLVEKKSEYTFSLSRFQIYNCLGAPRHARHAEPAPAAAGKLRTSRGGAPAVAPRAAGNKTIPTKDPNELFTPKMNNFRKRFKTFAAFSGNIDVSLWSFIGVLINLAIY